MVGAAAERLLLELRDAVAARLVALHRPENKKLKNWQIKPVFDELQRLLSAALDVEIKASNDQETVKRRESFVYHFPSLVHQIRASRNEAAGSRQGLRPAAPTDPDVPN